MSATNTQTRKTGILGTRPYLTPYDYPYFEEVHTACIQSPWSHLEVAMGEDLMDWESITEVERFVIGGLLRGFTLAEISVGCYWRDVVAKRFQLPEICMIATTFSHEETVHARAYSHLEDTLGIDTYQAFLNDPISVKKIENILNRLDSTEDLASSLAIFSGAVEGVSLFSSFAILLSFSKRSQFKGLSQILSWSVMNEMTHSMVGIKLYHILIEENPELTPDPSIIYEGFDSVVENEVSFVSAAFEKGDLETISKDEAIDFIHYRANKKLMELKLKPKYHLTGDYKQVKHFFDTIISGKTMNDFFALSRNGGGYSAKLNQVFTSCKVK